MLHPGNLQSSNERSNNRIGTVRCMTPVWKNQEKVSIGYKKYGESGIYGELKCEGLSSDSLPYISASSCFSVPQVTKNSLTVRYQDGTSECQCRFLCPRVAFSSVHQDRKNVACLDVTPGGLGVSADTNNNLHIWTTDTGEVRRNLNGHYGDVYTCRFYPSGVVVLSGGADCQLKIWCAQTGKCAATMIGHKAGITDTAIVDRGKNVVSCSRDGTASLWDCSQTVAIATLSEFGGILNGCSLGIPDNTFSLGTPAMVDKEVGTEGKLLLLSCENGTLHGCSLQSKQKVFTFDCKSAVNCCTYVGGSHVACGTEDGCIHILDIRNTSEVVSTHQDSRSAILSLIPHHQGLFASTRDGSCFHINHCGETTLDLTGPDCDAVYSIAYDGSCLYTGCRDGIIRKYMVDV